MSKITKVISIKADPHKVVEYIANVRNHPAFISALKSVDNLEGDPKHSATWDWTFVMAGAELKGRAETAEYAEGQRYSFRTTTGITSKFTYSVESEDGGSRLTMDIEYELPQTVLAKAVDQGVVERLNEEEGTRAADNLKAILEG
jgi:uncharacterized membrane protein